MMDKNTIPKATLGRLPDYLEFIKSLPLESHTSISATVIAKSLRLGEVQVKKDLSAVSGAGRPKIGYETKSLIKSLEKALGREKSTNAVLVGAGRLGKALLEYDEFEKYGIRIVAAFDLNEQVIKLGPKRFILPMKQFENFCKEHKVQIGIITVGKGSAQAVCDKMTACGISAIWNFAPCKLSVLKGTLLQQENLALSLAHLNHQLCN